MTSADAGVVAPRNQSREKIELTIRTTRGGRVQDAFGFQRIAWLRLHQHAKTLEAENLVASELRYPDRTGETYAITYNPNQRWYYFPKMQPDEAVLIRCFDSARSGPARFSAHGAFDDP